MKLAISLLVGLLAAAPASAAQRLRVGDDLPDIQNQNQTVVPGRHTGHLEYGIVNDPPSDPVVLNPQTWGSGTPAENVVSTGPNWMLNEPAPNCPPEEDSASVRIVLGEKALLTVGPGASLVGPVQIFGADGRLQLSLPAGAQIGGKFAVARFCTALTAKPSSETPK